MRIPALPRFVRRFAGDRRGATIIEFAAVAPVMGIVLLGGFDVAHTLYMKSVLEGVVQKAARDSALEGSQTTTKQDTLDAKVTAQVHLLNKNAVIAFSRRFYRTYTEVSVKEPEDWDDNNNNGTCDPPAGLTPGEPYWDANHNGKWDKDGGNAGQGGAKDATLYTVTVSYPRLFPLYSVVPGLSSTTTVSAATVLRNQPYADQGSYAAAVEKNC